MPLPKEKGLLDDKKEAYERDAFEKQQKSKMGTLQDFEIAIGQTEEAPIGDSMEELPPEPALRTGNSPIRSSAVAYKEISKFPAVKRDLALLIDKKTQFAEIEKIAYETDRKLLKSVELYDVYEGKNLEAGKKSYAVSFVLLDENATLNDKQIDKFMQKLVQNLENKLDAKLR